LTEAREPQAEAAVPFFMGNYGKNKEKNLDFVRKNEKMNVMKRRNKNAGKPQRQCTMVAPCKA